jgi:hypothetical protein
LRWGSNDEKPMIEVCEFPADRGSEDGYALQRHFIPFISEKIGYRYGSEAV